MTIKKALTFRASSIGDCLMGKYFLENVHAQYPQVRCGIVVASRGDMIKDLLAAYPWIEVIEANRSSPRAMWRLLRRFWRSDIVVTPYTTGNVNRLTKLVAWALSKRGGLIGFEDQSREFAFLYDTLIALKGFQPPRILEGLALHVAKIPVSLEWPTFAYLGQNNILPRFKLQAGKYVVVHLFSGTPARGLSPQNKQALLDALAQQISLPLVLTGIAKERDELLKLKVPANATIVAGETTIQELASLIDSSALVVALGSGVSHIASHLQKKGVALADCRSAVWCTSEQYGTSAPRLFTCPEYCLSGHDNQAFPPCMNSIDMQAVARACSLILSV